jgi:UDP-N-acetylmuramate dehydrogenase
MVAQSDIQILEDAFGDCLQVEVSLKRYTAARIGGKADVVITANSSYELAAMVMLLWKKEIPFIILGSGSNVLVSDAGVRQVVVVNRAKKILFNKQMQPPTVWINQVPTSVFWHATQLYMVGRIGMGRWHTGTVGGAIYGNAAHMVQTCLVTC